MIASRAKGQHTNTKSSQRQSPMKVLIGIGECKELAKRKNLSWAYSDILGQNAAFKIVHLRVRGCTLI